MKDIVNNIEKILNEFIGKNIIIIQEGFLESRYCIQSLNYSIEYEILNVKDKKSDNYLKINLNQIYKIENNEKQVKLFLDNDTIIGFTL